MRYSLHPVMSSGVFWLCLGLSTASMSEEAVSLDALYGALSGSSRLRSSVSRKTDSLLGLPDAISGLQGLTSAELAQFLAAIAIDDPTLGRIAAHRVLDLGESAPDSTAIATFIWLLDPFEAGHLPWALKAVEYAGTATGDLGQHVLRTLHELAASSPDVGEQLSSASWIADGINDEEAALLGTLSHVERRDRELFEDLIQRHYSQSTTITLPLAGDVNIRLIKKEPFRSDEEPLSTVAESVRAIEELMGVPFPTSDVVVLLVNNATIDAQGYRHATFVVVRESSLRALPHLIARHYRFGSSRWLEGGVAEFTRAYVDDRRRTQSLSSRRVELSRKVEDDCRDEQGTENLRHMVYIFDSGTLTFGFCLFPLAEQFLLAVFNAVGEEAFSSALRELYLSNQTYLETRGMEGEQTTEENIYTTFLKHTPPMQQEEFREIYRRLHGGPYPDPDIDFNDDHADQLQDATSIAVGSAVGGSLDYRFDFDYFRFQAMEDERYEISVEHETLRPSSAGLFDHEGKELTQSTSVVKSISRTPTGYRMLWTARRTGDYYFAVRNFGGYTGSYMFRITRRTDPPDDHGDTLETATGLDVGEVATGVLDDDFDYDYFRFQADGGEEYRVYFSARYKVAGVTRSFARTNLYYADGSWAGREIRIYRGEINAGSYSFFPTQSQRFYIRVENQDDVVGREYTLMVRKGPFPEPWVPIRIPSP